MMKKPTNWNEVKEISDRQKLPLGAYVCKILKTAIEKTQYGDQLIIGFDIDEGDFKGFYRNDFNANQNQDKKWKGLLRIWLPKDDGSEKDEFTKQVLKGFVTAVEKSNLGYQFDWNESSLVNKAVGILFRNEEWDYNGKHGWAVRPFRALSCASVREGSYTLPKDKPLSKTETTAPSYSMPPSDVNGFVQVDDDDDLPF